MQTTHRENLLGDPSTIHQHFHTYNVQLLCCRQWWLKHWEFGDLSFPYWRLYYNREEGAALFDKGNRIELSPDKIYLIAPNTSYSTQLFDNTPQDKNFCLEGNRMENNETPEGTIAHMFIHFNLGFPYDKVKPGIISMPIDDVQKEQLASIANEFQKNAAGFSFSTNLSIHTLINQMLHLIPDENWQKLSKDHRVNGVIDYIENNLPGCLDNETLAQHIQLATNSFTRLFTEEVGISPQRYVKKQRINKACILLHHSHKSIEEIANDTGFADRYHFSRVFKEVAHTSPAAYRKLY